MKSIAISKWRLRIKSAGWKSKIEANYQILETRHQSSASKYNLLENKMNDTLKQDEQFRADRVRIENERDEAKATF